MRASLLCADAGYEGTQGLNGTAKGDGREGRGPVVRGMWLLTVDCGNENVPCNCRGPREVSLTERGKSDGRMERDESDDMSEVRGAVV